MKANWKSLLIVITIVVLLALLLTFFLGKKQEQKESDLSARSSEGVVAGVKTEKSGDYVERLARFMAENGMVLYGSYQSTDTKKQKDLFGDSAKYLDYVECDASGPNANPDECISQKIDIYPTWLYQGKQYVGIKSLGEIAEITGSFE